MTLRTFALIYGIAFLLVGIMGFIPGINQMHGNDPNLTVNSFNGHLLGLFHVNLLHNLIHVAFGIWGIAAYSSIDASRMYAKSVAVIYFLFVIMGLIPALNTVFGLVPIEHHDVWLHLLLALVAGYFGFLAPQVQESAMTTDTTNSAGTTRTM